MKSKFRKRVLICLSVFQTWKYHTECDLQLIEQISKGYQPNEIKLIVCHGTLIHCDLRENIRTGTGCSKDQACNMCIQNLSPLINEVRNLSLKGGVDLSIIPIDKRIQIEDTVDKDIEKEDYTNSEVCSYYRLDELSYFKSLDNKNNVIRKLRSQSKYLNNFFDQIIRKDEDNLGIVFNGRLTPHSDIVTWFKKEKLNIIVHERGEMDGVFNIRLNRKALDQQEFNLLKDEYLRIWEKNKYPKLIKSMLQKYIGEGNLTSKIWKHSKTTDIIPTTKKSIETSIKKECIERSVLIYLSSTDEAYGDDGTILLELQLKLLETFIVLKKEGRIKTITVKPHPDTISRIDLTCQHTIIKQLITNRDELEIIWPEDKSSNKELLANADIVIVPHSSIAIELATYGIPFITFQDSPFREIGASYLGVAEILDKECLLDAMNRNIMQYSSHEYRQKNLLTDEILMTWVFWNGIKKTNERLIEEKTDKGLERIGNSLLISLGELAKNEELNNMTLRNEFITQAKKYNTYFESRALLSGTEIKERKVYDHKTKSSYVSGYKSSKKYLLLGNAVQIKTKIDLMHFENEMEMESCLILLKGFLIYKKTLTLLYGWNIPVKAQRPWDLVNKKSNQYDPMLMTFSKETDFKVQKLWSEWEDRMKESNIYDAELFNNFMNKNGIKCYDYKEPISFKELFDS